MAQAALLRLAAGLVVVPALLVLSAGTLAYWEAWAYLAVLLTPMVLTFAVLLARDRELLERRLRTGEKDAAQRRITALAGVFLLAVMLISGFDRRFGWSDVPVAAVVVADLLVLAAYGLFVLVLREMAP